MKTPDPARKTYLGMRPGDLEGKWYAKYWNPHLRALPDDVAHALLIGPQAEPLTLARADAAALAEPGYLDLENGYALSDDGAMHVATLTRMPRVSPKMLDWWFRWHTAETQRYELWHPRAHLFADVESPAVGDGARDRERYVGSTSFVDEYVGSTLGQLLLQFRRPSELGFEDGALDLTQATATCATFGLSGVPVDWGALVHHVRRVDDGAEMRSRFWVGGKHVSPRGGASWTKETKAIADALMRLGDVQARAMLVHCSRR